MAKDCLIRLEEYFLKDKHNNLREQLKSNSENDLGSIIKEITIIENNLKNLPAKYNDVKKV